MDIDLEDLTLDELEEVLEISGSTFKDFESGNFGPSLLKAIAFVSMKRTNPQVTLEEVGRLRIKDLTRGNAGSQAS